MTRDIADEMTERVERFFTDQLADWADAAARYMRLSQARSRTVTLKGGEFELIHLPDRAVSTCARTDTQAIKSRPCFLCASNRPAIQHRLPFADSGLEILVNPFPIYPRHLTLPSLRHEPQLFSRKLLENMLMAAFKLKGYTVFYNGPHSGASAPDHLHLQAIAAALPQILHGTTDSDCRMLKTRGNTCLYFHPTLTTRPVTAAGGSISDIAEMMTNALSLLPVMDGDDEPRLNLYATRIGDDAVLTAVLRHRHRPTAYGNDGIIFSPGAIDMGGRIVLPRESDFDTLTADSLQSMMDEVLIPTEIFNRFILDCISHDL